jgi:O-antigen/teichoic acid export membrane protein
MSDISYSKGLSTVSAVPVLTNSGAHDRRRWISLTSKAFLAVIDQALTAASHFFIGLLLARWLLPGEYGAYSLGFAIFLLLSLVHQAVLLEPQRIFGPSEYEGLERDYFGVLLWIHSGVACLIVLALGLAACITAIIPGFESLSPALAGLAVAVPWVLLLWLIRGVFYVRMSPQGAVRGNVIYALVLMAGIVCIRKLGLESAFSVFLCMGAAAFISSVVMLQHLKPVLSLKKNSLNALSTLRQHWHYGRWLLLSSALSWFSSDVYYAILSSVSGLAAAGQLRALMNFALPLLQTCNALSLFALPYVCRIYTEKGSAALRSLTWRLTWMYGTLSVVYWAVIIMLRYELLHSIYDARYNSLASSVIFIAASSLPLSIAFAPALIMRTLRLSSSLLQVSVASSIVALLIGIPITKQFGLAGALAAMTASNVVTLAVSYMCVVAKIQVTRGVVVSAE